MRRVRLQNILSHEDSDVEFADGVVSIVGPNGAGKSSIVDSIYVALFADSRPDIRGGKKEFIVMRGRDSGRISVVFEVGGRQYLVEREVSVHGVTQAYLYEIHGNQRKLRSYGVSNVVEDVCRLLGLPMRDASEMRRIVRATIFSAQDELTKIIDISDSERREWILSLLGLSHLEKALESVRKVVREEVSRIEGEYGVLKGVLDKDRSDLAKLEEEISQLMERGKSLREERDRISKELKRLEEMIGLTDEAVNVSLSLRIPLIARLVKELEDRIRSLAVLKDWDPEFRRRLIVNYFTKKAELKEVEKDLNKILREVGATIETLPSGIDIEKEYKEIEQRVDVLSRREGEMRERARLLNEILSKLEIGNRCPICGSTIASPEAARERLRGEISDIEKELSKISSERDSLLRRRQFLVDKLKQLLSLKSRADVLRKDVENIEREISNLDSKALETCRLLGIAHRSVYDCDTSLDELKAKLERDQAKLELLRSQFQPGTAAPEASRVEELKGRLAAILGRLGLAVSSEITLELIDKLVNVDLRTLRREMEGKMGELRRTLGDLESRIGGIEGSIESKRKAADSIKRRIQESEAKLKELERKVRTYGLLERFSDIYLGKSGEVAKSLTKAVRESLEKKANKILSRLRLPSVKISEEFQILVQLPGGELPIKNASGGERVGISLALRLALAEIVMGRAPTALIVDEPTVYLDSERREQLFHAIRELSRSLRQLIVVTHDDAVARISDRVILVESVGGISRTSQSELVYS